MSMEGFGRSNCCICWLVGGSVVHPKSTIEPVIPKVKIGGELGGHFWNIFVLLLISVEGFLCGSPVEIQSSFANELKKCC